MKLLSVEQARAVWLFPMGDMNPTGKFMLPFLLQLVNRYKFASVPNISEAIKKNEGIFLEQGVYTDEKRGDVSVELAIYNDGLIADTHADTDVSDDLLEDALTHAQKEFGLVSPKHIRKQHTSKIYVETERKLNSLSPSLAALNSALNKKLKHFGDVSYELGGINLVTEQAGPLTPPVFRFERAETNRYSDNRYYSIAGLRTADHLELLDQLESLLS